MNRQKIAQELVAVARELTAGSRRREMLKALKGMDGVIRSGDAEVDKYDALNALAKISRIWVKIADEFNVT